MKIFKTLWLIPVLGLLPVMPSLAHVNLNLDRIERRIERQHIRINQGVLSGELTRQETKLLRRQHRQIKRLERRYLRNGRLNHRERHSLENKLDRANNLIYRLKHNNRRRIYGRGWRGDRFAYRSYLYRGDGLRVYFDKRGRW